jgi:hypothetical protein
VSLLPSPIPHPLDYSPWALPGWVYEALDWVVGVEWPEGNERAVWDLADQWYGVAEALTGPHGDAVAAAGEVRSGYGGIGAVAEAFDAAWRRVADGDEAPLPVLLAVSGDIGRLVEECGCDIEGAKLEVWIELGILVVELLSLAVAAVLTAGAASPAAGAAIAASRFVVQQIFKRLMAQLARKTLKRGLKEAGERAAKRVAEGGVRGLARKAARGGLEEAAEEGGITLATQTYQNSTGRRHGLDLTDAGMSALGGLAGGAAAPLAGLGRHATGRFSRVGEHLGREMTGETIAEQAASLATGQGPMSLEDAARAAASGVTGSVTGQADKALQHRLDGRMAALAGFTPIDLGGSTPPPQASDATPWAQHGPDRQPGPSAVPSVGGGADAPPAVLPGGGAGTGSLPSAAPSPGDGIVASSAGVLTGEARAPGTGPDLLPASQGVNAEQPSLQPSAESPGTRPSPAPAALPDPAAGDVAPSQRAVGGAEGPTPTHAAADPTLSSVAPADATQLGTRTVEAGPPSVGGTAPTAGGFNPASSASTVTAPQPWPVSGASPGTNPTLAPAAPVFPDDTGRPRPARQPTPRYAPEHPGRADSAGPPPRSPEWYAAQWAAEREAFDRRRYRDYFQRQRAWYEDKRRRDSARKLRDEAEHHYEQARWLIREAHALDGAGRRGRADRFVREGREKERQYHWKMNLAEEVLAGRVAPPVVEVDNQDDFQRINTDDPSLVLPVVQADGPSALTGDDGPPPIDRSRRYGQWGGLRPPLALHQTDLERAMPRDAAGRVLRTADPRRGDWFRLANDGGPAADPTRSINCLDCTLSLYETWVHGRPRVSAPRTFDAYAAGDINRPLGGEIDGPGRAEDVTGGRFQQLALAEENGPPLESFRAVNRGFGSLERQLRAGGHGSFAFLVTTYEGGGSHAWVALNQNGSVVYLDPQRGSVSDMPLYTHCAWPAPHNVTGIDALVLGPDGRPMPVAGAGPGRFSQRGAVDEQPPEYQGRRRRPDPEEPSDDELFVNRVHLLGDPGSAVPGPPEPGDSGRREHVAVSGPAGVVADAFDLDQILAAGVTPAQLANHLDGPALRRLVPHLDNAAARDVARLFEDGRVRQMLDDTWQDPPPGEPLLAGTLVKQLAESPRLARIILTTPELATSLTARPVTLHHLASHEQAIDVLGEALAEVEGESLPPPAAGSRMPQATPLKPEYLRISASIKGRVGPSVQPGFDYSRLADSSYRAEYLDALYAAASDVQSDLSALARALAEPDGRRVGTAGWRREPKDRQRAKDKIDEYGGDVSRLVDLAGAKVEFESLDELYAALGRLAASPEVRIVRFKDRFRVPQESGYRDILLVLRMRGGHLAELRLHLAGLESVAVWEHALYEVRRDLDSVARQTGRGLTGRELALYDAILRREQEIFWRALQEGL